MKEVRSEGIQVRCDKLQSSVIPRTRLRVWFIRVCSSIVVWTCLVQLMTVSELWHSHLISGITNGISHSPSSASNTRGQWGCSIASCCSSSKVSCNGGLNQMRAAVCTSYSAIPLFLLYDKQKYSFRGAVFQICDMVTVARFLNLTLVVPELDKTSFWADPSNFEDIFDVKHFIDSLRDEVRIVKRVPKKFSSKHGFSTLEMPPVSWSNEKYYLEQILPLFEKHKVLHFNKTDTRLANNGLPLDLQKLRCRVNYQALKFTPQIENLGHKLIQMLHEKGSFVALHLRYEMDMLAFSGCTCGCTDKEAEELKQLRYAFPWWREKEIVSDERRSQGLCPLTPEEAALVLRALGFGRETQIYIAAGEIYGGERRLAQLRASFPQIVKKDTLLTWDDLRQFQNHSSQMAALDFMVSEASNTFVPTYDGNMAKLVEGHRRYSGFKRTILLDRKKVVELVDMHQNGTLSWIEFADAVRRVHETRIAQPTRRRVILDKPKEEDYFYANPHECLCEENNCDDLLGPHNSSQVSS
ncbi:O-fucosyltransferase 3 [Glycine soja]